MNRSADVAATIASECDVTLYRVIVHCFDGRERIWSRYDDRAECERVAEHLTSIGCPSRCASDNELALYEAAT